MRRNNGISFNGRVLFICILVLLGVMAVHSPVDADEGSIIPINFTYASPCEENPDTQIELEWYSIPDTIYYVLHRYRENNEELVEEIDTRTELDYVSFVDDEGLEPETNYTYKIYAYSDEAKTVKTGEGTVTVSTQQMPAPVINSAKYNINNNKVTLSWTNKSQVAVRSIISTEEGEEIAQVDSAQGSYTFTMDNPVYGQAVQYQVISADDSGHVSLSSKADIIPIQPPVITNLTITNGTATVSWESYSYIDKFELQRSRYENGIWSDNWETARSQIPAGSLSISDTPDKGGTYRYRLKAKSTSSYSGNSNDIMYVLKPEAPSNVEYSITNDETGNNTIKISWDISQYNQSELRVLRKEEGQEDYTLLKILSCDEDFYEDENFDINKIYYYKVVAYESEENQDSSEECPVSTYVPEAPSDLGITVETTSQVNLQWEDNSTNEEGFRIERREGSGSFSQIATVEANTTEYTDTDLEEDVTYTYRIAAYNVFGDSEYSNEVSTTTETAVPPDSLTLTPTSSSTIEITWSYSNDENYGTVIERKTGESGTWSVIATLSPGVTSYTNAGLLSNTQYFYRVKSVINSNVYSTPYPDNDMGIGVYTMLGDITLYGSATSSNEIELSWSADSGGTQFIIERKMEGGDFVPVDTVTSDTTWYDSYLIPNAEYYYRIKAVNENNESIYSNEICVTNTYLEEPSDFEVCSTSDGEVELTWNDNTSQETGFEIWRKEYGESSYELYATVEENVTEYVDEDVEEGVRYYYKVRAFSIKNNTYSSFTSYEKVVVGTMEAPSDLEYTVYSSSKIKLEWEDNSDDESGFEIERKIGRNGEWKTVDTVSENREYYKDYDLDDDLIYYYRVKVYSDDNNNSAYSEVIQVSTDEPAEPSKLTISAGAGNSVKLTWKDNSYNEEGFKIQRKAGGDGSYKTIGEVGPNVTTFTDTWLSSNTYYYYRIKAYNEAGNSYSDVESYTTGYIAYADNSSDYWWLEDAIKADDQSSLNSNDIINRAEFISMVVRAFNFHMTPVGSFEDVNVGDEFYDEIMVASNLGIISGDEEGKVYPLNAITREDMAVIIVNSCKVAGKSLKGYSNSILENYWDKDMISSYAVSSMASLVGEGLITGKSPGSIDPKATVTRSEAASIIYNIIYD